MERGRALTLYITLPCLIWGAALVVVVTQYPDSIDTLPFRAAQTLFAGVMALILYTKKDELSGSE